MLHFNHNSIKWNKSEITRDEALVRSEQEEFRLKTDTGVSQTLNANATVEKEH